MIVDYVNYLILFCIHKYQKRRLNWRLFSGLEKLPCYAHTFSTGERLSLHSYGINDIVLFLFKTGRCVTLDFYYLPAEQGRGGGGGVNFIIIVNQKLFYSRL